MNNKPSRKRGWEEENLLAEEMGFACVGDAKRGGGGWCRFQIGNWHVWSLGDNWQVAKLDEDGRYRQHFTKTNPGKRIALREALEHAKALHEKEMAL